MESGGLNVKDIETLIKASRLAWIGKLFSNGPLPWNAYFNYLLKDLELEVNFYLAATMMSKSVKYIRNFVMSFFSGGQILDIFFQQSLLCLNT